MSKSKIISVFVFFIVVIAVNAQDAIPMVKIDDLKKVYTKPNDTTYIINFFATWCGPCMQEIPILNKFYEEHKNTATQLIFVSLDRLFLSSFKVSFVSVFVIAFMIISFYFS